jgi:hypothetical protein
MSIQVHERFIIGSETYVRSLDLQGTSTGLDPSMDPIESEDDPDSCAQKVVDLAFEMPGKIFRVFDSISKDHIAIVYDGETREELLAQARAGMRQLEAAGEQIEEAAPSAEH